MRITFSATFEVERKDKRPREPEPYEVGLHASAEQAHKHTGPSMGFRIPDPSPEWADRQASK